MVHQKTKESTVENVTRQNCHQQKIASEINFICEGSAVVGGFRN